MGGGKGRRRIDAMKWVEIITLRSPDKIGGQFVDELLKSVRESDVSTDASKQPAEIRVYHHSVFETDFSIHIYWKSEPGCQDKSPLGLRLFSALRNMGLLNHSVWVQTTSVEFPPQDGDARSRDRGASVGS